ncbi:MAG: hypothetical protein GF344_04215 [Chitinivibrionales bacterium]|nr:hypothetical protein [Chitinivibrionales bacterium]MBD3356249.1 hypothetical protein [Chitinivibrionales bacterium]
MPSERRKHERSSMTGKLQVERQCLECGRRHEVPVYLRDISSGGFSGTYFGKDGFRDGHRFYAINPEKGDAYRVDLVWTRSTLDTVHMLGFKIQEQGTERIPLSDLVIPAPCSDDILVS